ncbi:MAG: CRISPR-associated endonuclease Cas1 [Leptospiraceae bacterium]|nr:MAG: CRISPR-associated endonuclease Cas1 [Leptospiraceae bacterium]
MIKHLIILETNGYLHYRNGMVVFSKNKEILMEVPLRKLKTIQILSNRISISSYLIYECSKRSIDLFFMSYYNPYIIMISNLNHHATVRLRKKQLEFIEKPECFLVVKEILIGKIKNQRSLLLYFGKSSKNEQLKIVEKELSKIIQQIQNKRYFRNWQQELLGLEGKAAKIYWQYLKNIYFRDFQFPGRIPRISSDIINSCLNLGYTILLNMIWRAVSIAGLEPYAGFFHSERSGKPSLVLDLMEEYRAWVVDRNVIKLRNELKNLDTLKESTRKKYIAYILNTFSTEFSYNKKRYKLETIIQKQIYRLCGTIVDNKPYKNYIFRW